MIKKCGGNLLFFFYKWDAELAITYITFQYFLYESAPAYKDCTFP